MTVEPVPTAAPTVIPAPTRTAPTTAPLQPTATQLTFLPGLDAAEDEQILTRLGFTCADGGGSDDRIWTCSYHDEVDISFYGASPPRVSAYRVVTTARRGADRRSWLRTYADALGVDVWQWVSDHTQTNEAAKVGSVWVQMTHDDASDGVFISTRKANR
ncbi:MAG: hypothetical protein QOF49_996 [Chloroflexota bacterium]|nr:hypothetical protein [Chloroflexota bacterium]